MAEYTLSQTKRIAELFCEGYNKANNSKYSWDDNLSYQPEEPVDFRLIDGNLKIDVQVTRATADPEREFILPNLSGKVVEEVRKMLEKDNLPPLSLYVNFHNPPKTKKDVADAIFWLHYIISHKVSSSISPAYFTYDNSFDSQFLHEITRFISDINIWPTDGENGYIRFGYGWGGEIPKSWPGDDQRVIEVVQKKKKLMDGVILLVDSGWSPISDYYIQPIIEGVANSKLKEIWIAEDYSSQRRIFRVK